MSQIKRRRWAGPSIHLLVLLPVILTGVGYAQHITGRKTLCIGELWHEDEDIPSGGFHRSFCWPGNHYRAVGAAKPMDLMNGCARECGLGYGMKNWTDWKNKFYPYMVGGVGESLMVYPNGARYGCVGHEFKIILRQPPPTLMVDGEIQPARQEYDELDPHLISDAALAIKWSFDVGLTVEQVYYAYASPPFDSYLFIDFNVINSGNVNQNLSTVELKNQFLHGLCFTYAFLPMVSHEGAEQTPSSVIETSTDDWVEYYGESYLDYLGSGSPLHPAGDRTADSLRIFYAWDGNNGKSGWDDTGDPDMNTGFFEQSPGMGRLLSHQYLGLGLLHADKSPSDTTNDLSQPFSTVWRVGTQPFFSTQEAYEYYFNGRHMDSPQEMGFTRPDDPVSVARPNPYISLGPYEMPFGSDIHFTLLAAVNGINYDLCNSIGLSWWTRWKGGEGILDEEKNRLVASGRDSLFKYFGQATRRYFKNRENGRHPFDAPEPPPPPALTVTSAEKSVILKWSDVSQIPDHDTAVLDFAGYRVYRSVGRNDTTFVKIWECGGNTGIPVATEYVDRTVQRGFAYFYYVTAYDDGSQNWEAPGRSLESGKYWNMMLKNKPAHPFMSSEQVANLNQVKVVPNPYHDQSVRFNWPGEENKLLFINVPLKCTIKVYTASGDLVKTLWHDSNQTECAWNQVTDSNQLIYSGVYFYIVESDIGRQTGKFVVVRSSKQRDQ
ncbi:MAG TPA: T9SS type A sorting domain-containing protein [bacterium]|nr:T9SS type A sorting domain-containing protein [bacterium]